MRGVQFFTDDTGNVKSVLIDLDVWGELWEDVYDLMVLRERRNEETIPWEQVKEELRVERMRKEAVYEQVSG